MLFLLVLNFVLAIIVEAYMKVREFNAEFEGDAEFFSDVVHTLLSAVYGRMYGWPNRHALGEEILSWKAKKSVSLDDLLRTGMFKSTKAITTFLKWYVPYEFLNPPEPDPAERGYFIPTEMSLKEQYHSSIQIVLERRKRHNRPEFARKVLKLIASEGLLHQHADPFPDVIRGVMGQQMAQPILQNIKNQGIDRDDIKYIDQVGWQELGVTSAIQRAKLLRAVSELRLWTPKGNTGSNATAQIGSEQFRAPLGHDDALAATEVRLAALKSTAAGQLPPGF